MYASLFIMIFLRAWKAIIRKPDVPVEMVERGNAWCFTAIRIFKSWKNLCRGNPWPSKKLGSNCFLKLPLMQNLRFVAERCYCITLGKNITRIIAKTATIVCIPKNNLKGRKILRWLLRPYWKLKKSLRQIMLPTFWQGIKYSHKII